MKKPVEEPTVFDIIAEPSSSSQTPISETKELAELRAREDLNYARDRQIIGLREYFAKKVFWLAVACIVFQFILVLASLFPCVQIETSVLISVILATVVEVLGILMIIVRSLFPQGD